MPRKKERRTFESDFDRDFERTRLMLKIYFVFVSVLAITVGAVAVYVIFHLITDPGIIGRFIGEAYNGFENATAK